MYYAVITIYAITKRTNQVIDSCMHDYVSKDFYQNNLKDQLCPAPLHEKSNSCVWRERKREREGICTEIEKNRNFAVQIRQLRDMESHFLDSRREYYICTVKTLRFCAWLCIKKIMLLFKTKRDVFVVFLDRYFGAVYCWNIFFTVFWCLFLEIKDVALSVAVKAEICSLYLLFSWEQYKLNIIDDWR